MLHSRLRDEASAVNSQLRTPVVFLIFNRPSLTARVFAEIARAKPKKLLVVADGPRLDRTGEAEKCEAARAIVERVDWDCEVYRNYSVANLGCKKRVGTGITWAFKQVEEAIILEDDCLPHPTFFQFCEELLNRYRDDERVMHISGSNFQFGQKRTPYSYYFSRYHPIWGWASWRRAWQYYDAKMTLWPTVRESPWLLDILGDATAANSRSRTFDMVHAGQIDTWDYQWTFACWIQNGVAATPNVNLVSNIGFSEDATHTTKLTSLCNCRTEAIKFPLEHPPCVVRQKLADQFHFEQVCGSSEPREEDWLYLRLLQKCFAYLPGPVRSTLGVGRTFMRLVLRTARRGYIVVCVVQRIVKELTYRILSRSDYQR